MKSNPVWVLGLILNLFYLYAVFQIYFQSPVLQIDKVFAGKRKYDRVVFIVCDGLRADTFYRNPTNHPYLTSVMYSKNSAWGISDTRVPTESRPGHIALFAGIYEDPSAIFTGWKKNFVEFDSLFNRSTYSIALGSPDIVNMFAEGRADKAYFESYPPSWQDFTRSNSSNLDTWVLDKLKNLIKKKKLPVHNELLIFLHLLGVDNTGHAFRPNSEEYLANLAVVDKIVAEVEELVNRYYEDSQTLFVFTSDHGMTDWGSHGAGSIDETETPFVIWGSGVSGRGYQTRLKQADFTAIVAGSLGIVFPTNSIGRFPTNIWDDIAFTYSSLLGNFFQLHELLMEKKVLVNRGLLPFVLFPNEKVVHEIKLNHSIPVPNKDYTPAIKQLEEGIDTILEGIVYYERYDQSIMKFFTIYTFLIWMMLIGIAATNQSENRIQIFTRNHVFDFCVAVFVAFIVFEWSAFRIPYIFVPVYLTRLLVATIKKQRSLSCFSTSDFRTIAVSSFFTVLVIEILVITFYQRGVISIGLLLNSVWCIKSNRAASTQQKTLWFVSTLILALFPTVPLIGLPKNPFVISLGSALCAVIGIWSLKQCSRDLTMPGPDSRERKTVNVQINLISVTTILVHFPEFILTRIFAWLSIIFLLVPIALSSKILSMQFLSIFLAVATPFCYLSLSYEVFFLPSLFLTLFVLLKLELVKAGEDSTWKEFWFKRIGISETKDRPLLHSFRLSCLHLFFVYLSFFGIGNIASISSFDPSASRCFVSVFSPFTMMALLLVKIVGPFLLVASAFRLCIISAKDVERSFLIVLFLCQGMALHMFLNVTNIGSWLEIGTSISHYVIVQVTTLFLFFLFFLANVLTGIQDFPILTRSKLM